MQRATIACDVIVATEADLTSRADASVGQLEPTPSTVHEPICFVLPVPSHLPMPSLTACISFAFGSIHLFLRISMY